MHCIAHWATWVIDRMMECRINRNTSAIQQRHATDLIRRLLEDIVFAGQTRSALTGVTAVQHKIQKTPHIVTVI